MMNYAVEIILHTRAFKLNKFLLYCMMIFRLALSFLFSFLWVTVTYAQMDTNYVEIWGVPKGHSELSYMQLLNKKKLSPCMADLRPAGFKDAYVAGIGDLRLVLLRDIPTYSFNPVVKKSKIYPPTKVIDLLYFGINDDETNFIKRNYFDLLKNDSLAIDKTLRDYEQYGIKLDKEKIDEKFSLIRDLDSTSKDSCLNLLKFSTEARLKEAALLGYISEVKNDLDIIAIFPFLLDNTVGDDANTYITNYFKHHELKKAYWEKYHPMLTLSLNNPNPFIITALMELYQKNDYGKKYADQILKEGNISILEILQSRHIELKDLRDKTTKFLSFLTGRKFGNDCKQWTDYISKYKS